MLFEVPTPNKRDDFTEFKESQVLELCRAAKVTTGNLHKVVGQKLDVRNMAAHPSELSITRLTAEEFIKSLVANVVLKI